MKQVKEELQKHSFRIYLHLEGHNFTWEECDFLLEGETALPILELLEGHKCEYGKHGRGLRKRKSDTFTLRKAKRLLTTV